MLEELQPVVEFMYRTMVVVLWVLAGAIVVPSYLIANLYFEKWWKARENF